MKKNSQSTNKATLPAKKADLKTSVKSTKINLPRLAGNHNETLLTR